MTPTPPSGIPVAIAGQLQRDDGQDRGIRYLAVAVALLAVVCVGAIAAWRVSPRPVALPPSPVVHIAAAPPCPACPACAACPACPQPVARRR